VRVRTWYAPTAETKLAADENRFPARISSAFICVHLWLILFSLSAEPRWKIQFFYDRADSNFDIEDIECPTIQHCVAGGVIDDKKGHQRGAVVVTSDGGQHWSQFELKEQPVSLFFLNDSLGWMVTERGLWSTAEGGRAWTKLESRKGILQTWFLDANHGYITGLQGLVQETTDGGKTWVKLDAGATVPDAQSIDYDLISFQGTHGIIVGAPNSSSPVPIPKNPQSGALERALASVTILETLDGGKKWTYGAIRSEGELAQLKISAKGFVVTLILYSDPKYPVGSAVFLTSPGSRSGQMIFGKRDRAATDIALLNNGGAVLVAIEPPGNSAQVPIPGKLKILESGDLKVWHEMDVDYRAVAQRAVIAGPDAEHLWVATDTGAILSLVE
jgi:hypothetical protein